MESYKVAPGPSCLIWLIYSNILMGPGADSLPVRRCLKLTSFTCPALRAEMQSVPQICSTGNRELCRTKTAIHAQAGVSKHSSPDQMSAELDFSFLFKLVYVQTHHLMKFSTSSVWVSGFVSMSCINLEVTVAALLPYCVMDDSIYRLHTWLCK